MMRTYRAVFLRRRVRNPVLIWVVGVFASVVHPLVHLVLAAAMLAGHALLPPLALADFVAKRCGRRGWLSLDDGYLTVDLSLLGFRHRWPR